MTSRTFRTLPCLALLFLSFALLPGEAHAQQRQSQTYQGHRFYVAKGIGWGWIKTPGQRWGRARWAAIKERPNQKIVSPHRKLTRKSSDHEHEYELTGYWADYDAYDPKWNALVPVFILESYKPLGPAKSLGRRPGPSASGGERDSNPNTKRRFRVTPNQDGSWFD